MPRSPSARQADHATADAAAPDDGALNLSQAATPPKTAAGSRDEVLQKGDRVVKIEKGQRKHLHEHGTVEIVKVAENKVKVKRDSGGHWNLQSAGNFRKLKPEEHDDGSQLAPGCEDRRDKHLVSGPLLPDVSAKAASSFPASVTPLQTSNTVSGGAPIPLAPSNTVIAARSAAPTPAPHTSASPPEGYDAANPASLGYNPDTLIIPGMRYKSGVDRSLRMDPYDRNSDSWYVNRDAPFPPTTDGQVGFTEATVKALPRPHGHDAVKWGGRTYALSDWLAQLQDWNRRFPNLKDADGGTCHETVAYRRKQTSHPQNIKACFDKCSRPSWPADLDVGKKLLDKFRVDMWGNVVCLPESVDGKATDGALCFFDVDHTFPFSRGGRSQMRNFEALQHAANRWVKSDNLAQSLDPRDMQCGLSARQLLALVRFVEARASAKRKDTRSMLQNIENWITQTLPNGQSFCAFQADVKRSVDGETLFQYLYGRWSTAMSNLAGIAANPQQQQAPAPSAPGDQAAANATGEPPSAADPGDAQLKVRLRGGRVEVWGDHTYTVKEGLKSLRFRWDADEGRRCWWRVEESEAGVHQLLANVQRLASQHAMQCPLPC